MVLGRIMEASAIFLFLLASKPTVSVLRTDSMSLFTLTNAWYLKPPYSAKSSECRLEPVTSQVIEPYLCKQSGQIDTIFLMISMWPVTVALCHYSEWIECVTNLSLNSSPTMVVQICLHRCGNVPLTITSRKMPSSNLAWFLNLWSEWAWRWHRWSKPFLYGMIMHAVL